MLSSCECLAYDKHWRQVLRLIKAKFYSSYLEEWFLPQCLTAIESKKGLFGELVSYCISFVIFCFIAKLTLSFSSSQQPLTIDSFNMHFLNYYFVSREL